MMERAPSARTKSSGLPLGTKGKFMFMAKSRSRNWELAPESIMHVARMSSLMKQDNIRGSSNPKSPNSDTGSNTDADRDTDTDGDIDKDTHTDTDTHTGADTDTGTHTDIDEILKARDLPKRR